MKTLHDLQHFFDDELHDALEQWYGKFTEDTGQKGLDLFIAYLAQKNLVSPDKLNRMRSGQPVQISAVENIAKDFVEAASNIPQLKLHSITTPQEQAVSLADLEELTSDAWSGVTPVARIRKPVSRVIINPTADKLDPAHIDTDDIDEFDDKTGIDMNQAHMLSALNDEETPTPSSEEILGVERMTTLRSPDNPAGGLPINLLPTGVAETAFPSGNTNSITGYEDTNADDGIAYHPTAALSENSVALEEALAIDDENHDLIGELGRGAMGVVFIANEKNLGRKVAFKQIRPEVATDKELMMRFLREAQITAQLDHPAIIPVHSLVKGFRGLPAYTMKVVEGTTLDVLIQETKACYTSGETVQDTHNLSTRMEHFLKVCDAMAYAHSKGVLHRDLKPKNILVGRFGEAYIVDWGLARLMFTQMDGKTDSIQIQEVADFGNVKTQVGQLMGTPQYMSPEQAQGLIFDMDGRSDLYSLGVILFELVFLEKALEGDNLLVVVNKVVKGELKEVPEHSPYERIPSDLSALIRKATAPKKEDRYESVKQFAEALRSCLRGDGEPVPSASVSKTQPMEAAAPPAPRTNVIGWIACLIIACLAGAGFWYSQQQHATAQKQLRKTLKAAHAVEAKRTHSTQQIKNGFETLLKQVEQQVHALRAATKLALLSSGKRKDAKFYLNRQFLPPDIKPSRFYHDSTSLLHPVIKLAPGLSPKKQKKTLTKLSLLRDAQRSALFNSLPHRLRNLSINARLALLERGRIPILSTFVVLPQGIVSLYPGRASFAAAYQPTHRSWYRAAAGKRGIRWSQAFINMHKIRAISIACTASVFTAQDTFTALVGAKLRLNSLAAYLLELARQHPWIKTAQLLNSDGQILVKSDRYIQDYRGKPTIKQVQMPIHRNETLRAAIKANKKAGTIDDNGSQIRYVKLQRYGWYLVLESRQIKTQ